MRACVRAFVCIWMDGSIAMDGIIRIPSPGAEREEKEEEDGDGDDGDDDENNAMRRETKLWSGQGGGGRVGD